MSGAVLLSLKMGVALFAFVGMSKVVSWYHSDEKGGAGNDRPKNIK